MNSQPVLILFGPTASGKTAILERLFARSGRIRLAEVISADSMQVYRGLDIGTAKPDKALRDALPHHLIDIKEPSEQFNAGEFVRLAEQAADKIAARGALPVISGGTGFYLKNFIQGLPPAPPSDPAIRECLRAELERHGTDGGLSALFDELQKADPLSAGRIHPNDTYRILRALEVFRLTGKPLSAYNVDQENNNYQSAPDRRAKYHFLLVGLEYERELLYRRINMRCREMFRDGLAEEAQRLFAQGFTPDDPALKAIGYKEFFVKNDDGSWRLSTDCAGVENLVAQNSRHYAKRQITWFKKVPGVAWLKLDETPRALEAALQKLAALLDAY
jgi:tRNA dimethylallyltransferase